MRGNQIEIIIPSGERQFIYYNDSTLLHRLSIYPWVELVIIIVFLAISYVGLTATRRVEQNRLWVGLSKETAHQLGTPISSLIGWIEYLRSSEQLPPEIIHEMSKDVERLADVSSRFSKIGSRPGLETANLKEVVEKTLNYMEKRVSRGITLKFHCDPGNYKSEISEPLIQWVLENLIKNAVDATEGKGIISVDLKEEDKKIMISISDTGKGIPSKKWKRVFQPGYTTKQRGWGLGLTLAKRIVEEYHDGEISIVSSQAGEGTTFLILLKQSPH